MLIQGKLERTEINLMHFKWGSVWKVIRIKNIPEIQNGSTYLDIPKIESVAFELYR